MSSISSNNNQNSAGSTAIVVSGDTSDGMITDVAPTAIKSATFATDVPRDEVKGVPGVLMPSLDYATNELESIAEFFMRPVTIHTMTWSTSAAMIGIDPWLAWTQATPIKEKLTNFAAYRGDLVLTVYVNGLPSQLGAFAMYYAPHCTPNLDVPTTAKTFEWTSQLPHILFQASAIQCKSLRIPWHYRMPYKSVINDPETIGWVGMSNIVSNTAAFTGVVANTPIGIKITAHLENPKIVLPTIVAPLSSGGKVRSLKVSKVNTDAPPDEGIFSAPLSAISAGTAAMTGVPLIGGLAKTISKASGVASDILKTFGFSRPQSFATPNVVIPRGVDDWAYGFGEDNSTTLGAVNPKLSIPGSSQLGGLDGTDTMSFNYLKSKWGYIGKASFPILTTAADTQVVEIPLTPLMGAIVAGGHRLTPLGTMAFPFQQWRGTLEYKIVAVMSPLQSIKLVAQCYTDWDGSHSAPGVNSLTQIDSCIMDMTAGAEYVVSVGYLGEKPWTSNFTGSTRLLQFGSDGYGTGVLTFKTFNLGAGPGDATIAFLIYIRGGDDFEVGGPALDVVNDYILNPNSMSGATDLVNASYNVNMNPPVCDLNHTKKTTLAPIYFGESLDTFRTLVKRYSFFNKITCGTDATGSVAPHLFYDCIPAVAFKPLTPLEGAWTWAAWVLSFHAGFRGGFRHKIWAPKDTVGSFTFGVGPSILNSSVTAKGRALADWNDMSWDDATKLFDVMGNGVQFIKNNDMSGWLEFRCPGAGRALWYDPHAYNTNTEVSFYYQLMLFAMWSGSTFHDMLFLQFGAADDDFTPFFFNGGPLITRDPIPDMAAL